MCVSFKQKNKKRERECVCVSFKQNTRYTCMNLNTWWKNDSITDHRSSRFVRMSWGLTSVGFELRMLQAVVQLAIYAGLKHDCRRNLATWQWHFVARAMLREQFVWLWHLRRWSKCFRLQRCSKVPYPSSHIYFGILKCDQEEPVVFGAVKGDIIVTMPEKSQFPVFLVMLCPLTLSMMHSE